MALIVIDLFGDDDEEPIRGRTDAARPHKAEREPGDSLYVPEPQLQVVIEQPPIKRP